MMRFILLVCFTLCLCSTGRAAIPALEREVTLSLNNEKIGAVLNRIQEQTGLVFSYQPSILNSLGPVSLHIQKKTVREALAMIFPKSITYKARDNYVIIKEAPVEKDQKKTKLSGYVYDSSRDVKLANVTIYDKNTLQSVTTDQYGYYSITVPNTNQCLSVNKENYQDTCVSVSYLKDSTLTNISISPVSDAVRARDSLYWKQKLKDLSVATTVFFKRFKGYINTLNVKDTLTRNVQASFFPFLGSNGLLSGNVYNRVSINVIGGYSRGTTLLEVGSIFNIDRERSSGAQLAGLFNVVGDTAKGIQAAGLFNVTGKEMAGVQAAGLINMNLGNTKGIQLSGLLNLNGGKVQGVQGAALMNVNARETEGVSLAGLMNINRFSMTGIEVAGLMNITADTLAGAAGAGLMNLSWYGKRSLQVSGILNSSRYGDHNVQLSGLMNTTGRGTTLLQVSALFNRAHVLKGAQLGLINYADSASGVPVGLLSIVKKGKHQVEVSADELLYANLSLRTGVNAFYNILTGGIFSGPGTPLWQVGYGIGTSVKINKKISTDLSVTAQHLSKGSFYLATSDLCRFYLGAEFKIVDKIAVAAGPTFNLYWTDTTTPDYESRYRTATPQGAFHTTFANGYAYKGWLGARVAFRFL